MRKSILAILALLFVSLSGMAVKMSDLKIYINPGHGGYDSDDRNIVITPYSQGDSLGYWESKSNLYKGLFMYHILDSLGAKPYLSRIKNTTDDDRSLSGISAEANQLNCDLFFSIHSNAGETVNYPLMLYRENAVGTPRYPEVITLSNILWDQLHSSKLSLWTRDNRYVSGDLTFYPQWGTSGLGVLRNLYVVGLLSEGGMHEHRPEAHRLMNMDFCWLEAWHFVKTIMEYYGTEDKFVTGNVAGVVYDNHNTRENTMNIYQYTTFGRDRNKPLNGASIKLLDKDGKVVQTRTTDKENNGVFVFRNVVPGEYTVVADNDGYYEYTANVTVTANEVTYNDLPMIMKREMPLEIASYTPNVEAGTLVSCVEPIVLTFNTDIDEESLQSAFSIEPAVAGAWTFTDSYKTATFRPETAFDLNSHYKVTISTAAKTADTKYANPNLQEPLTFEFDTKGRNKLELIQQYPDEGDAIHYKTPSLEFRFDKTLNAATIYDQITVTDSKGTALAVNKRSSTYNKLSNGYGNVVMQLSSNLVTGENYKVTLSDEIKDSEGIPLTDKMEINFTACDQGEVRNGVILETFETDNIFAGNEEESLGTTQAPKYYKYTSKYLFDKASGGFSYNFANSKDGVAIWNYTGDYHILKKGATIGAYVYGDLNNHELYLGCTSGTDTKYIKLCDVNFLGWKYCEIKLDDLLDDMEYLFSKVKITQRASQYSQIGNVNIDNLTYDESNSSVGAVTADVVTIYPNPASDMITVSGVDNLQTMELYSPSGAKLKVSSTAEMALKDLATGVYMLKINSADKSIVKTVIVRK